MNKKVKLAVYGTLRGGFCNHALLEDTECIFKGYAEIPYEM